ncbi:elongation of very long chain fatty acids protein AAEL008004-like [Anoplophora glabripennis]|uniref:elongation of very long chain fatty acids protein AAEL008004-like n=1 Tax=Anoplophora glabripennis TaxID=217634 RepID=UPI000873C5D0|nr:elongation of very long chain fatty acids protein AAEL008004-like [Anoplophora glabripennis]
MVKVLGPRLMENRKPFELKRILIIFNLFQVIFNGWLFYEFAVSGWLTKDWSYKCQPMDYTDNPRALRMAAACWWFYISKYIDFLDTIFFVLRKKDNQITKLHVIHHSLVPLSSWFGTTFSPGGHGTFCCFLNTFVHVVMYSYYFLAALGPKVQKYLWWKKYITTMQMIQFIAFMVHSLQLFVSNCDYPRISISVVMVNAIIFLLLFSEFYKDTYNKKPRITNSESFTKNGLTNYRTIRINKHKNG